MDRFPFNTLHSVGILLHISLGFLIFISGFNRRARTVLLSAKTSTTAETLDTNLPHHDSNEQTKSTTDGFLTDHNET